MVCLLVAFSHSIDLVVTRVGRVSPFCFSFQGRLRQGKAVIQTNSATQHQDKCSSLPRDRLPYIYMVLWCHGEGHKYARHSISGMKNSVAKTFSHEALHEGFTLCKLRRPTRKITFSYAYLCLSCPVLEIETTEKWPVLSIFIIFRISFRMWTLSSRTFPDVTSLDNNL